MKPIILIGGGGHCKSVIEAINSIDGEILGILDSADKVGTKVLGYTIIGTDDDIPKYVNKALFVITVGHIKSSIIRRRIAQRVEKAKGKFATVIASTANVSRFAKIAKGSVILHGAMVNADATIEEHCIINTMANIGHDVKIGCFTHISTGVMVCGNCTVGSDVFIGSQSVLSNDIVIVDETVVGAGGCVSKSISVKGVYIGNPARVLKNLNSTYKCNTL